MPEEGFGLSDLSSHAPSASAGPSPGLRGLFLIPALQQTADNSLVSRRGSKGRAKLEQDHNG